MAPSANYALLIKRPGLILVSVVALSVAVTGCRTTELSLASIAPPKTDFELSANCEKVEMLEGGKCSAQAMLDGENPDLGNYLRDTNRDAELVLRRRVGTPAVLTEVEIPRLPEGYDSFEKYEAMKGLVDYLSPEDRARMLDAYMAGNLSMNDIVKSFEVLHSKYGSRVATDCISLKPRQPDGCVSRNDSSQPRLYTPGTVADGLKDLMYPPSEISSLQGILQARIDYLTKVKLRKGQYGSHIFIEPGGQATRLMHDTLKQEDKKAELAQDPDYPNVRGDALFDHYISKWRAQQNALSVYERQTKKLREEAISRYSQTGNVKELTKVFESTDKILRRVFTGIQANLKHPRIGIDALMLVDHDGHLLESSFEVNLGSDLNPFDAARSKGFCTTSPNNRSFSIEASMAAFAVMEVPVMPKVRMMNGPIADTLDGFSNGLRGAMRGRYNPADQPCPFRLTYPDKNTQIEKLKQFHNNRITSERLAQDLSSAGLGNAVSQIFSRNQLQEWVSSGLLTDPLSNPDVTTTSAVDALLQRHGMMEPSYDPSLPQGPSNCPPDEAWDAGLGYCGYVYD